MGGMRKTRVSRAIMGGCRHSLASVEELRDFSREDKKGNRLDGGFRAENQGMFLKI